jgi:hypothetical protein
MKLFLLTITSLISTLTFCQKNKAVFEIDSLLKANPGLENYRYWYGGNEHSICDFRMDTLVGKLSKFRYTSEGSDTLTTDYFFIDNYLVKAHSFKKRQYVTIGTYYFKDNKVFYKTGRNIRLVGKGYFKKIAPKYFHSQLDYIYSEYERLKPTKTRFQINVPKLLTEKRWELDRRNSYYN